jgi:esterase/lipase superfamily enzyme
VPSSSPCRQVLVLVCSLLLANAGTAFGDDTRPQSVSGKLQGISLKEKQLTVLDRSNRPWQFQITDQTKFTEAGKAIDPGILARNQFVQVFYRETKKGRVADQVILLTSGALVEVMPDKTLIWRTPDGKTIKLDVDPESKIYLNNKEVKLADLKKGDVGKVAIKEKDSRLLIRDLEAVPATLSPVKDDEKQFVQIFYATDRKREESSVSEWGIPLIPALVLGGLTLGLFGVGYIKRSSWGRYATIGGVATAAAALTWAVAAFIPKPHVPDKGVRYGSERSKDGALDLGICQVSIPLSHKLGKLETPSIVRGELKEDPAAHVVLHKIDPRPEDDFYKELTKIVGMSSKKEALVFIHGFNVTFEDAARRTAQLAYDLKFPGAAVCYSWPSQGSFWHYTVDEANAEWSASHLKKFLLDLAKRSGAERIHLIAHSMGNRVLTWALEGIGQERKNEPHLFQEAVLTAPDVDADVFREKLFRQVAGTCRRVTLYASARDWALLASKKVHGSPRLGDTVGGIVILEGMDSVDVSAVDTSLLGHSYYGDNSSLLADLYYLIEGQLPDQRFRLRRQEQAGKRFWVFVP